MATADRKLQKNLTREWREGFTRFIQSTYDCPGARTLDEVNLEEGDTLPEDATYEIIKSVAAWDKNGIVRTVTVIARLRDTD